MARTDFIPMVSLELDDEDKEDAPQVLKALTPDFPWGLRIRLTEVELEKLGLSHDGVEVGEIVHGHFMGRVLAKRHSVENDEESCCVEIQIEDLAIESEDEENEGHHLFNDED